MQLEKSQIDLSLVVPFGVEIEVNSFDLKSRPDGYRDGVLPKGIYEIAFLVNDATKERVTVSKWCNNHNNNHWVIKPDSSCGLEVCSPVYKGWYGAKKVADVVSFLRDKKIRSDSRCSFHVHFDVSSFSEIELLSLFCWWIKLEGFFMDAMPSKRKVNPYCRLISQSNIITSVAQSYDLNYLIEKLGVSKYYSLNSFHYYNKRRKSVEFRIMDNFCCLNPNDALNWVALLHHFIHRSIKAGLPPPFKPGDCFSGYCWLDALDSFKFLDFASNHISPRLVATRDWLAKRLLRYGKDYLSFGLFSNAFRGYSYHEVCKLEKLFH